MKKLVFFISILSLWSCSKKPTACIEAPDQIFLVTDDYALNCSQDYDYHVWLYDDGYYNEESNTVLRHNNTPGFYNITLKCHNDNGRKSDEVTKTFYAGRLVVDSVVLTSIGGYVINNIQITYNGVKSNEIYDNSASSSFPLSYTFESKVALDELLEDLYFYNSNYPEYQYEVSTKPHASYNNPQVINTVWWVSAFQSAEFKGEIYWHLGE